MKIGIVLINWAIGGSEKRFSNLFRYLYAKGKHEYVLFINKYLENEIAKVKIDLGNEGITRLLTSQMGKVFDRPYTNSRDLFGYKIPGFNFISNIVFNQLRAVALAQEQSLKDSGLDLVHFVFPNFGSQLNFNGPKVLSCQDTKLETTLLKDRFFVNSLHKGAFVDIASERIKKVLVSYTGINDDFRLRVNPCSFIDYTRTFVSNKEPLIAFVGNLYEEKNPKLFLDAIINLQRTFKSFTAVILGKGPLETELKTKIREHNLDDTITLFFSPKPEEYLSRALIFVSLQHLDNYHSQALMEAMACGCAIIASDVGETYQLVSDNVGFRVPFDVETISEKLLWLLENPKIAEEMGQRARLKVMAEQTIDRYSVYLEKLYEDSVQSTNVLPIERTEISDGF